MIWSGLYKISCCLRAKCFMDWCLQYSMLYKRDYAWYCLFFPFSLFLPSFLYFFISILYPFFPLFFPSFSLPPCLQNGVGAYERRSLARTLCRALVQVIETGIVSTLVRIFSRKTLKNFYRKCRFLEVRRLPAPLLLSWRRFARNFRRLLPPKVDCYSSFEKWGASEEDCSYCQTFRRWKQS